MFEQLVCRLNLSGLCSVVRLKPHKNISNVSIVTQLPLQVGGLVRHCSGENARVGETRSEQHPHHEDEEDATDRRDGRGQVGGQEGTAADKSTKRRSQPITAGHDATTNTAAKMKIGVFE